MSDEIDVDFVNANLRQAGHLLARISDDLAPAAGKAGMVPADAVADLLDLAARVDRTATDIYQRLLHVGVVKAQGNGGTLVSPSGLVGWRVVRPQGRYSRGGVVRMTDAELEEAQS